MISDVCTIMVFCVIIYIEHEHFRLKHSILVWVVFKMCAGAIAKFNKNLVSQTHTHTYPCSYQYIQTMRPDKNIGKIFTMDYKHKTIYTYM